MFIKIRGRRSEIRGQRSEIRGQARGGQERWWHAPLYKKAGGHGQGKPVSWVSAVIQDGGSNVTICRGEKEESKGAKGKVY